MSKKSLLKKFKLAKAERRNHRVPPFVVMRSKRRFTTYNPFQRDWRTDKLRISD